MMRIDHKRLEAIYAAVAKAHGASEHEAKLFAEGLVLADLRGVTTHGIAILPYYHQLLGEGVFEFGKLPEVEAEGPSFARLNGHRNVGQVVSKIAMEIASKKASETGIAIVTARNGGPFSMGSAAAMEALEKDQIGIAMGNGFPLVAPWGGRDIFFCTNPLAIAAPAGNEPPVVIDMATSKYSMGQVVRAARDGRKLPDSVVTPEGVYSDDPRSAVLDPMIRESPMTGAIQAAGPKGYGWLLIVEILSGILSGANASYINLQDEEASPRTSYGTSYIVIDTELLLGKDWFEGDMEALVRALNDARPGQGFDRVRVPGARGYEAFKKQSTEGVEVRDEEWQMVLDVGEDLEIDLTTVET